MNTLSLPLNSDEQKRLALHLRENGFSLNTVAHARIAGKKDGLNIVLYQSGKLVVQGKRTREWVEFALEPEILQRLLSPAASGATSTESAASEDEVPRIGIDESGKGDFFGPLVIAGYYLTPGLLPLLQKLGVRDSKQISSDDKMIKVAEVLREQAPGHVEVLRLAPQTYNDLVKRMGSVNRVLAWGHATVLENLLTRYPAIQRAVADQFGPEHQIKQALKTRGKAIELIQRHRAESDPAVAAASILARADFVNGLRELSAEVSTPLPKGATHVRGPAEDLVKAQGPEVLRKVAKTHFRTTRQVLEACGYPADLLGTPEPKKWVKRS
ncbi:MAG: ribonuclease HIII [Verrucomicrobia bacterium]|nr:ribonuclease HIII [Verrucomicrobiota bacterium]MCH8512962.1 ribonuclease HIII [Kiritimatiellia bacterium]